MWSLLGPLALLCFLLPNHIVFAQFNIFEQMFGGQPFGGQPQQQQRSSNVASDSAWYRQNFEAAQCDKYLCQGTLSCVDKPSHCPCPFPVQEDKIEISDDLAICGSKGGWKTGEFARKVELARKGLI